MEVFFYTAAVVILLIMSIFMASKQYYDFQANKKNPLPPSPLSLPIIGHLHLLRKGPQHRILKALSDKYGPIIYLLFGNRPTVVISSAAIAEECFTSTNDVVLANRPEFLLSKILSYNNTSIPFSPYGDHWRNLRRVSAIHVFSSLSLKKSAAIRAEEIRYAVQKLLQFETDSRSWEELNLSSFFIDLAQNVIMKMVCGKRWDSSGDVFRQIVSLAGTSDYIPILRWIDFGVAKKKVIKIHRYMDKFLQGLIDESRRRRRRRNNSSGSCSIDGDNYKHRKTILEAYLSLQEEDPDYYTDNMIKVMIQSMFSAGIDTSMLTMQWAMAHLLNKPDVLDKAREEIDKQVTKEQRLIEDSDLSKLPYLRCIVSETLRLCPSAPLLLPHFSSQDCTINGYEISRGTTFIINVWAIHRDPDLWEDPTKFKPERFQGVEEAGCDLGFKFMPFGKGRRSCPGNNLGLKFVGLALGTLIQCFEWKRVGVEMVELEEKVGLGMRMAKPLTGLYKPRTLTDTLLSQLRV